MSPTPFHPYYNFRLDEPSTSTLTRRALMMDSQPKLYSRSANSSGGLERNTIIFIVIGIVCLLVILTGFYLVSRHPRATSNAPQGLHGSQPPSTPSIPPHLQRDLSERWKIWKTWRHNGYTDPPISPDTPTSNVSPVAPTITSKILPVRRTSNTHPPSVPRPSHARRVTSLSVATSFSHSHITDEALNNFRLSAYDLDGDLEVEMLNSARDDVWPGHALAMEECCEDVSVEGARRIGELPKGDNYENADACQSMAPEGRSEGSEKDVRGVTVVVMERESSQPASEGNDEVEKDVHGVSVVVIERESSQRGR